MPAMFGYAFAISDIRVTLGDGSERDCLQKIYPVGRFLAMGFAGSVRIGFAMVERLTRMLENCPETEAWDPTVVAEWWPQEAATLFRRFPEDERDAHCHLMLISVHPNEPAEGPWPRSFVHVFRSPDFAAEVVNPQKVAAIGSGANFAPCREEIEKLAVDDDETFNLIKSEMGGAGNIATVLGFSLTRVLQQTQPRGISSHLNYCWAYRGRVIIRTNDHATFGPRWSMFSSGSGIDRPDDEPTGPDPEAHGGVQFTMPALARSWSELVALLGAHGESATRCTAVTGAVRADD